MLRYWIICSPCELSESKLTVLKLLSQKQGIYMELFWRENINSGKISYGDI